MIDVKMTTKAINMLVISFICLISGSCFSTRTIQTKSKSLEDGFAKPCKQIRCKENFDPVVENRMGNNSLHARNVIDSQVSICCED